MAEHDSSRFYAERAIAKSLELEDADVEDAAVIGIPSETWGETPLGLIVLRQGNTRSSNEILDNANAKLGKHQRISRLEKVDRLPRSSIGKILKRELRAQYANLLQ